MEDVKGYCVKCKEKDRKIVDGKEVVMQKKGGKTGRAYTGKCEVCGTTMYKILPSAK
ncbi:MAG: hypothetical protein Q8Q37_03005 [bacterium]|nr:hypothetical protein [bacterium]